MKKYCKCGYQIWLTTRWNGLAHVLVFVAGDEDDPAHQGREITHCPKCGNALLSRHDLVDEEDLTEVQ